MPWFFPRCFSLPNSLPGRLEARQRDGASGLYNTHVKGLIPLTQSSLFLPAALCAPQIKPDPKDKLEYFKNVKDEC